MTAHTDSALDPRLAEESVLLTQWPLSRLLLRDERRFPWLVLVPRVERARELSDLTAPARAQVMEEIAAATRLLLDRTQAEKINVGALGNIVSQLHVHVVGRRADDPAWPGPVWGFGTRQPHAPEALAHLRTRLTDGLSTITVAQ